MDQPEAPEKANAGSKDHLRKDTAWTDLKKKPALVIALKLRKALLMRRWIRRLRFPSLLRKPNFKSPTGLDGGSGPSEVETAVQFEPAPDAHPCESNPAVNSFDVLYGSTTRAVSTDRDSTRSGSITHQDVSSSRTHIEHVSPSDAVLNDTASIATSISTVTTARSVNSRRSNSTSSSRLWINERPYWGVSTSAYYYTYTTTRSSQRCCT